MWSRSTTDIENVDIICFGHLLYEMCMGQEMTTPKPSMRVLEMEMEQFPQVNTRVYSSSDQLFNSVHMHTYINVCVNFIFLFVQILDVLNLIFEPSNGACPSVEELVLCDLFRSIDLRELRGPCFNVSTNIFQFYINY